MTTEADYISELRSRDRSMETSAETLLLADEAVRAFPTSCELWVIRGDLIQLGPESGPPLDKALASYRRAIDVDPTFAEAWDEIGHYYDAVLGDELTAQRYFQEAERLRRSDAG